MTSVSDPGVQGGAQGGSNIEEGELACLATVFDPLEAEIILGKLRSAGIAAYSRHEALSVVYGLTMDGAGRQEIMVRADDLEEARAALETTP